MTVASLVHVAEPARSAAARLRDGLVEILADDLLAIWLYGGQLNLGGSPGDVDLHVVVEREFDDQQLTAIRSLQDAIRRDLGIEELDAWYVQHGEATSAQGPRDLNWHEEVHDENWALKRAHWWAGAYVLIFGLPPEDIVLRPRWPEIEAELLAQAAAAVTEVAGDCPEPAALTLRLCRVAFSLTTREVVHSKLDAARSISKELSAASRDHVAAAVRTYGQAPQPGDATLIREGMRAFHRELTTLLP